MRQGKTIRVELPAFGIWKDRTEGTEPMPWDNDIDTSAYSKTQDKLITTRYIEIDADGNVIYDE